MDIDRDRDSDFRTHQLRMINRDKNRGTKDQELGRNREIRKACFMSLSHSTCPCLSIGKYGAVVAADDRIHDWLRGHIEYVKLNRIPVVNSIESKGFRWLPCIKFGVPNAYLGHGYAKSLRKKYTISE